MLGHQIVGVSSDDGRRLGVPWLGWTCGECRFCRSGRENLCLYARFTGRDIDGGYAERTVADERYCFSLPDALSDEAGGAVAVRRPDRLPSADVHRRRPAPRALRVRLGRAHDLPGRRPSGTRRVRVRSSRATTRRPVRELARRGLGGASTELPPEPLDAAIIFASDGSLVPQALRALDRGGVVVCAGIHMSQIPAFSYDDLWEERSIRSVANLTRDDAEEFLALAPRVPVGTTVTTYPLEQAERHSADLRDGRVRGLGSRYPLSSTLDPGLAAPERAAGPRAAVSPRRTRGSRPPASAPEDHVRRAARLSQRACPRDPLRHARPACRRPTAVALRAPNSLTRFPRWLVRPDRTRGPLRR